MATQQHRRGRQLRSLAYPQNHPDHRGKVGKATTYNRTTPALRDYVGTGICQATAVEPVAVFTEGHADPGTGGNGVGAHAGDTGRLPWAPRQRDETVMTAAEIHAMLLG